jgi:hypothetical protein|tara:strand:+ start:4544 stop:4813 length:270 start_codon:yes stop_codon:yes gene_type:complete
MKKKTSPKVKKTVVPKVEKKFVETVFGNVPIAKKVKIDKKKSEESSIIQSLLGDIAFAVNGTDHSSIITALTKCHKDILNIKKDVGIAD